ncbi:glycosyltransferase family 4 protein [Methanothermobacter sp. K4]|uniref:glycosyltransferase family 4 protein n=1 Tax=Methanothermobacter sp. K4 TaxID=2913262 RepID=UPI001EDC0D80|nr:glycosyltransferase family 4 protein [Methanothermobacter sp. K4]MCG2829228.1 glycosyltransferase family 4 protein [Methanothermobacter sp. K4]
MKIVIIAHHFYPFIGGLEEVAFQQAKGLVKRGHDVTVITSNIGNQTKLKKIENYGGITVYRVSASDFLYRNFDIPQPLFNLFELKKILKKFIQEADVVHVHDRYYVSSLFATKIAKKLGKPVVLTVHVGFIEYEKSLYRMLFSINEMLSYYVVKNVDVILSVGEEIKNYISKRFARNSIVVSNAVEIEKFIQNHNNKKSDKKFKVLFVGRFTYKKGIDIVIDVAKNLRDEAIFICLGDGPKMDEIKETLKRDKIENVILTGIISNKKRLREYYGSADVLIFPSRKGEASSPLVMLEALASGLPVIVKDSGGHADLICDGLNGYVVDNTSEMVEKIRFLKENRDILNEMSQNARKHAEKFSWSENVEKLISIYSSVVR